MLKRLIQSCLQTIIFGSLVGIIFCTLGCHKKTELKDKNFTVITVQLKSTVTALHFSGTLGPLTAVSVLSPLDGRITRVLFQYGQHIQKGKPLITMDASKLSDDYRKTVSDFLQKKQSYETGLVSYEGTEALYKAGVISAEEYTSASSRQQSDTLSYLQAKYDLEKLLPQTNISASKIEELNLKDTQQINATLNQKFGEIQVIAPADGIALFPSPDQKKDTSGSGRLNVGDDIKAQQLILAIGDLSGFSMKINVSEISVNLIKPNLTGKITGSAFPGLELPGYVASVAAQANPQEGNESALGMFEVTIKIPKVDPEQLHVIRVGMSAAVELDIPEPPQLFLPIKAVSRKNGQSWVTILSPSGVPKEVQVITGKTTLTEVAILRGVSAGDHVVVPN